MFFKKHNNIYILLRYTKKIMKKALMFGVMILVMSSLAFASDLSKYPGMFVKNHALDVYIVVGKAAAAEDVIGAVDIATSLMQSSANPKLANVAGILDENILNDLTEKNTILVGGPCANSATAKIMGYPKDCTEGFELGASTIRLYNHNNGNYALLVAGRTAMDTRRATNVISDYSNPNYNIRGTEIVVKGADLSITSVISK